MKNSINLTLIFGFILALSSSTSAQTGLKNTLKSLDKSEFSIIIESGIINSQVYYSGNRFAFGNNQSSANPRITTAVIEERENERFINKAYNWTANLGFSAGIKASKRISDNFMDSKLSLDFISGLEYQEINITQNNYNGDHGFGGGGILGCYEYYYVRDLKLKTLSIPLELRANYSIKNFNISPTLGLSANIPVAKSHDLYHPDYSNNSELIYGNFHTSESLESVHNFTYNTISKIEISYSLSNQHKLKCSAFYNLNLTNEISQQLNDNQGLSTKGFQVAYEIPLS